MRVHSSTLQFATNISKMSSDYIIPKEINQIYNICMEKSSCLVEGTQV